MNCLRTVVCGESLGPRSVVGPVTEGAPARFGASSVHTATL